MDSKHKIGFHTNNFSTSPHSMPSSHALHITEHSIHLILHSKLWASDTKFVMHFNLCG